MGTEVDATTFSREDRKRHREKVRKGLDVLARLYPQAGLSLAARLSGPVQAP